MMLLFVCNRTDHSSITTDIRQILDIAYQDINKESMMPEQYENRDIPKFSIRLNVPRLPKKKSAKDSKAYGHIQEQGKKAFHLEVAKPDLAVFTFLATHAHRMGLDAKYFGKFAKLTASDAGQRHPSQQLRSPQTVHPGPSQFSSQLHVNHY